MVRRLVSRWRASWSASGSTPPATTSPWSRAGSRTAASMAAIGKKSAAGSRADVGWTPLPPAKPEPGWWTLLPTETDRWVEGIRSELRAERIERLKALAHRIDMRAAGALSRDRRARSDRRRHERRYAHHGYVEGVVPGSNVGPATPLLYGSR